MKKATGFPVAFTYGTLLAVLKILNVPFSISFRLCFHFLNYRIRPAPMRSGYMKSPAKGLFLTIPTGKPVGF